MVSAAFFNAALTLST